MSTYGFGPAVGEWGGSLSDLVHVPHAQRMLVALPEGLAPASVASASDNLGDAYRAVAPGLEADPGAPVLVVGGAGAGSIGLYAAGIARALGSEWVLYVDPDESRRGRAEALGAQTMAEVPKRLGPFPITVDASSDPDGLALALRSTAHQLCHLIRRAALAPAARDVHQGDHLPHRTSQRRRGDSPFER